MRYQDAVIERRRSGDTAERVIRHLVMPAHEIARAELREGERIGEFLERAGWSRRIKFGDGKWRWTWKLPTVCIVNGVFLLQRAWKRRRIKDSDSIVFLSRPLGGGNGSSGKQVLGLVALIAASALALWAGAALFGAGTLAAGLFTAGATIGASLLINALVAPKAGGQADAGTAQDTAPQAFALSAAGNNPRPLQTIPISYGRLRKYCDFATIPWSEFVGDEQYLNVLLCEGSGKYQHEQVLIDDTVMWDSGTGVNPDFDAQVAFYDPGQTVTLFPVNVTTAVEVSGQSLPAGTGRNPVNDMPPPTPGEWVGGFIASAPGTLADALALDFAFPAGCFVVNRDGVYFGRPVRIEAEYRQVDDAGTPIGPWSTLFVAEPTFNTRKPVKFSNKVVVVPGRYEVRARRYGAEAADFDVRTNGATGSDSVIWLQLRAYLQGNSSFAKESIFAIRIRATQISQGSARKFSVVSTRILPVWNGSMLIDQPTRNPLWAFLDAAINTDYGARRPVGKVDFNAIVNMAIGADTRGDTFDFEFRSPDQVPNAFDTILKATRARHRWSGDLISAVRDEERMIPQLLLTDREIVRGSLTVNWALNSEDQADAVLLEYLDENIWGPAEVQYPPNSEIFTATNPARIRLDGVIGRVNAQKEAAFFYRQALYRRTTITLDTEWEGKMLSYGSFVRVQSELPQSWGASGRVAAYNGGTHVLTLDPAPTWDPGQHYLQIRTKRGRAFGPVKVSRFGSDELAAVDPIDLAAVEAAQGMTISDALTRAADAEEASFVIGTATETAKDCIVLSGRPNGDRVTLTLAVDDPRVHDDDITGPPDIPQPPALRDRAAPIIILLTANFRQGVVEPILDAAWAPAANTFYYEAGVSYDDGTSWTAVYQGEQPSFAALVDYASLKLRVRGVGPRKGAYNLIGVEPPIITARPDIIALQSLQQGIKDQVTKIFAEAQQRMDEIAQTISSVVSSLDASTFTDKLETRRLLAASEGRSSASIEEVSTVVANNQAAFAAYQVTVQAKFDDFDSSIDTINHTFANDHQALAQYQQTVAASFGSVTSSISTVQTAVATIDGKLAATAALTLTVGGKVSGYKLYSNQSTSVFDINADIFRIGQEGAIGGGFTTVFQVGVVNGAAQIAIRGDMLQDGTITARNIVAGSIQTVHLGSQVITADKIAAGQIDSTRIAINGVDILNIIDGAVSEETSAVHGSIDVGTNPLAQTLLVATTFNVRKSRLKVTYDTTISQSAATGGSFATPQVDYILFVDFVERRRWSFFLPFDGQSGGFFFFRFGGTLQMNFLVEGLPPGFHDIRIHCTNYAVNGSPAVGGNWHTAVGFLFMQELRR
jgi:hypothetical protein